MRNEKRDKNRDFNDAVREPGGIDETVDKPFDLATVHDVFKRWLGDNYDFDTLDAMLAVAASERLAGDPPWLLIISGPGNAKTETVQATSGIGATVVSTLTSDAALLSGTPQRNRPKGATGGLLRTLGARGILAIKDVTSILSMNRDLRTTVIGALREIHDGHWVRNVGSDGGQTLTWKGRIVVIGACTTAWDTAHGVVSSMGDRFVIVRSNSHEGRIASGLQAIRNTGREVQMREELAEAVSNLIATVDPANPFELTEPNETVIVRAANLVTLARTGVELDYRGDVVDAHAPEMPTRLAKQLTQIMRGGIAIGMRPYDAQKLALRCARDSIPQLRLDVLKDIETNPMSTATDVRRRLQKPRATVDRTLQALHILELLKCNEDQITDETGKTISRWFYKLADGIRIRDVLGISWRGGR
jgi:hypothetical protein